MKLSCALKNSDELARGLASALQSRYNGHFVFAKDLEKVQSRRGINSADDILERCSIPVRNVGAYGDAYGWEVTGVGEVRGRLSHAAVRLTSCSHNKG